MVTRCCGSVPLTSASTSSAVKPTAESPFGIPVARMILTTSCASSSPPSASPALSTSAPRKRAACQWRSGLAGAVKRKSGYQYTGLEVLAGALADPDRIAENALWACRLFGDFEED